MAGVAASQSADAAFESSLFQGKSVPPPARPATDALPEMRGRVETAAEFEPPADVFVPDAELLWKPGSNTQPPPPARPPAFTDNEFWAPMEPPRGPSPTMVAADEMEAYLRGDLRSQGITPEKSKVPLSYAILGAALLASILGLLAIAVSR
jgi:hypothetical protein